MQRSFIKVKTSYYYLSDNFFSTVMSRMKNKAFQKGLPEGVFPYYMIRAFLSIYDYIPDTIDHQVT